jgi:hypothetical protein
MTHILAPIADARFTPLSSGHSHGGEQLTSSCAPTPRQRDHVGVPGKDDEAVVSVAVHPGFAALQFVGAQARGRRTQRLEPLGSSPASLRRSGSKGAARAYDVMIAATALVNELPVYTCNPNDFAGIDGLEVFSIPHPDSPALV